MFVIGAVVLQASSVAVQNPDDYIKYMIENKDKVGLTSDELDYINKSIVAMQACADQKVGDITYLELADCLAKKLVKEYGYTSKQVDQFEESTGKKFDEYKKTHLGA